MKTVIFKLDAMLPDIFFRVTWFAPALILPIAMYRYFSYGRAFQEFLLLSIIAFLIPGIAILLLNLWGKRVMQSINIKIDSQGILYLSQKDDMTKIDVKSLQEVQLLGRSKHKVLAFRLKDQKDIEVPWPYEISDDDLIKFKATLKVFDVRMTP